MIREVILVQTAKFPAPFNGQCGSVSACFSVSPLGKRRADSIRPYSLGGEAAAIYRTAQLRTLREAKSLPYRTQKLSVFSMYVTGRVREPTDRYRLRAALSGGIAAPLCISFREAWPRLVFFTFTGYNALVTFLKGAFRCIQKKMK